MTETQEQTAEQSEETRPEPRREEPAIPKSRFDEVNRRMKDAEKKAQDMETAQSQREEQQAQAQGEYQKLAEKRGEALVNKDARIKELENQIVTDKRYRSFVSAANGTILPEAFDDAFSMLTSDEWASVNEDDENGVRMLAQGLADRKPYLAAAPRGSGSGGSRRPVFGLESNGEAKRDGIRPFQIKPAQRHWK